MRKPPFALLLGLFTALSLYMLSCSQAKPAEDYLREASILEDQRKPQEAIRVLDEALALYPDFLPAYINRGANKALLGDYAGAIADYDKALDLSPHNVLALVNRGKNKKRLHDFTGSISDFDAALDIKLTIKRAKNQDAQNPAYDCPIEEIRLERGISWFYTDSLRQALTDIQFCIEHEFEPALSHYWRGIIYLSAGHHEEGCADLGYAASLGDPDAREEWEEYCR